MFLLNTWYAVAWGTEIGQKPFARTICSEPVVFFRTEGGTLVALEDRCCHRRLPLSMGKVLGDTIQCAYHGFTFDASGRCVKVPGQDLIPPSARVRSFPVAERYGLAWVFLGDCSQANPDSIPDYHWITDPHWGAKGAYFHVKAGYQLILENLLDLTHLAFVHATTIGNAAVVDAAKVEFLRGADTVDVRRTIQNCPPPPTYAKAGKFAGNIDRWQYINFTPPSFVRLETGGCDAGQQEPRKRITLRNLNLVTPETENTTHYLWAQCHDFDVSNQATTEMLFNDVRTAFLQDVEVFEAQQRSIAHRPESPEVDVNGDAGGLQARRILRRLLERQAAQSVATGS
jgi:phenylpropionate dioxygenase-like ring-hydroxylating dioxygenase large terminal subunit